ncbi:FecCD family ABC transporter permease [Caldibacillus thermoamylovorans]|uniref:FecCD family ABC transporter permease n=1 Tax=Caldibacillus thermoamylovorans TaxID=35841 RepID=UPI003B43BD2A
MSHENLRTSRKWLFLSMIIYLVLFVVGLSFGASTLSIDRLIPVLFGQGTFKEEFILFSIRLPRILILTLAGAALAMAGAVLQSVTRNDLADPGIIGINAGAGVGITVFYLFAGSKIQHFNYVLPVIAFIGGLLTAICIYFFSFEKGKGIQPVKLVLIGVGFASALSGLMILMISSAERQDVAFVSEWLAGSIWGTDWPFIVALFPWLMICIPIIYFKANVLNLLTLSEPTAIGLGVNINKERSILLVVAVALAAAAVSVTGRIGFIGLMGPHFAKRLVGPKHQSFLVITPFIGAILLVLADILAQIIFSSAAVPTGIVVAIIGAPYFLYLLRK